MGRRTVLVTGGSSGIGAAAVERFVRGGDQVWFTYRNGRERAEELARRLSTLTTTAAGGAHVQAFAFDQGEWNSHVDLIARLPGPVDVLVNNAAVGSATVADHAGSDEQARDLAMFRINSVGPLWLIRQLLPGMLERGYGKVVNISSVNGGVTQFPGFLLSDGMSKAALAFMTRQLSAELAMSPVDVFAICPGATETSMFEASTLSRLTSGERAQYVAGLPKGRLISPQEVAEVIWWLCGDAGQALHGAVVDASLGLGVHPGLLPHSDHSAPSEPQPPEPATVPFAAERSA
jgi:NAD(P)-dependent dehydrogenase (short-subunit alcohol dehydrogenase family)